MSYLLMFVTMATCVVVLCILLFGVLTFARGGEFNRKYGNKIMRWRIYVQALAVVLILLTVFLAQNGY